MSAAFRAAAARMNPGTGGRAPDPKGDACLYARRPNYESLSVLGDFVVLERFLPHEHSVVSKVGWGTYLTGNDRLAELQEGVAIPDDEMSDAAVRAFVQKADRESLPGAP